MAAFWPTCWIHDSSFSRVFLFLLQHFFLLCCILLNVLWPLCVFCTLWEQHNRVVEFTINSCFLEVYFFSILVYPIVMQRILLFKFYVSHMTVVHERIIWVRHICPVLFLDTWYCSRKNSTGKSVNVFTLNPRQLPSHICEHHHTFVRSFQSTWLLR